MNSKYQEHFGIGAPSYDEVCESYNLELLKEGGDFQIENGDLASTKSGDIRLGDIAHDALYRLVQKWRFSAPTLEHLFRIVLAMRARKLEIDDSLNNVFSIDTEKPYLHPLQNQSAIERYHELNEESDASEISYSVCAGSIILALARMLSALRDDLEATSNEWKTCAPLVNGYSIGSIIEASANNFRHGDEWSKTRPPGERQLRSISVLATILNEPLAVDGQGHHLSRDVSNEVLDTLSDGVFQKLNSNVLTFAHNLAMARRARS